MSTAWTKNGTHLALTNSLRLLWIVTPISSWKLHAPSSFAFNFPLKTSPRLRHNLSFSGTKASILPTGPSPSGSQTFFPCEQWDHNVCFCERFKLWFFVPSISLRNLVFIAASQTLLPPLDEIFASIFPRALNITYCTKNCFVSTGLT